VLWLTLKLRAMDVGRLTLPPPMLIFGWIATSVMALATFGFFLI
jgi:hypothetical protein